MKGLVKIKDLISGETIKSYYLVNKKSVKQTKAGKDYLDLALQDNTGIVSAKVWNDADAVSKLFKAGDIVKVQALVGTYNDKFDLNVKKIRKAGQEDPMDMAEFLPASPYDIHDMEEELKGILSTVTHPFLGLLYQQFLEDEEFMEAFRYAPAAGMIHHPYVGGLLEHTLSIVKILDFLSSHYADANRGVLLVGGFIHDIGKIREIAPAGSGGYTDEGILLGHMVLGAGMVRDKIRNIENFPCELEQVMLHIVISHQGELEWGAPIVPKTREALIIHYTDNLDAKQFIAKKAVEDSKEEGNFTRKIYPMNREFYKGTLA